MEKMSAATYNKLVAEGKISVGGSRGKKKQSGNKFGAQKTPDPSGGKDYDSKLEAKHGKEYKLMVKAGELISVVRQPSFLLAGGITYRADFLLLHLDGSVEIVDSKGMITQGFRMKEKLFREKYPHIKFTVRYQKNKTRKPS